MPITFAGFLGIWLADTISKRFTELEDALRHMFWWEEGFEVSVNEAGDLVSRGKCPIHKYYPEWCSEGCLTFISKIAERYGYTVERVKTMPRDPICEFVFRKG